MAIIQVPPQPSSSTDKGNEGKAVDESAKKKKMSMLFKPSFWIHFVIFCVINIFAGLLNHIDDTDETYGYWEPLHYLLFGKGMQTWEYSPQFAIRSYAFIHPFYLIGSFLHLFTSHRVVIFYGIRIWIGCFTATAEAALVQAVESQLSSPAVARMMTIFLATAPGVFFASTSFLPSAIAMSLYMHALASWWQEQSLSAIIWGGLAVLWTGWPFVALLYVPIGLHMLYQASIPKGSNRYHQMKAQRDVTVLIISAVVLIIIVAIPVVIIDQQYYGKWTVPALNIFLYNAVGSSTGDELYGVEPASYYIKNLLLNTSISWPIVLVSLPIIGVDYLLTKRKDLNSELFTSMVCLALWLGIMFSRPHKEERFLYPVYPLIIYIASVTIVSGISILEALYNKLFPSKTPEKGPVKLKALSHIIAVVVTLVTVIFAYVRIAGNIRNYSGYMKLWTQAGDYISKHHPVGGEEVEVCVGSEWYYFPSHFFLPANARLEYIEDNFKGILPQHFAAEDGTKVEPLQEFNNLNQEVKSRYIPRHTCDYIIQSNSEEGMTEEVGYCTLNQGKVILQQAVMKSVAEGKEWARAFDIPSYSNKFIQMKSYQMITPTCD